MRRISTGNSLNRVGVLWSVDLPPPPNKRQLRLHTTLSSVVTPVTRNECTYRGPAHQTTGGRAGRKKRALSRVLPTAQHEKRPKLPVPNLARNALILASVLPAGDCSSLFPSHVPPNSLGNSPYAPWRTTLRLSLFTLRLPWMDDR